MTRNLLTALLYFFSLQIQAQPIKYTASNAHSHNDYEQEHPFWMAYNKGFGSIEADVFLWNGDLPVAHERKRIDASRNLKSLYLGPLSQCVKQNKGRPYAQESKKLLLLIDCKTEGVSTLQEIISQIQLYPDLTSNKKIQFVITGNRPPIHKLFTYPSFINFDGDISLNYSKKNLNKLGMFSIDFSKYSLWDGHGKLDEPSRVKLLAAIAKAHQLKKAIRFWGAPDTPEAWKALMELKFDYINTDKIDALANFLEGQ